MESPSRPSPTSPSASSAAPKTSTTSGARATRLALGAVSPEVVEAAFSYSHDRGEPLALISSQNQIDHDGGYTGWGTAEYGAFIEQTQRGYSRAEILLCRDHCGPGFRPGIGIEGCQSTIQADAAAGFDLIHIDFCRYSGNRDEQLRAAADLIEWSLERWLTLDYEIGTDENAADAPLDLKELDRESDFFLQYPGIRYYVLRSGSLVMEDRQAGTFTSPRSAAKLLHGKGLLTKEHNADFMTSAQLAKRQGIMDCVNISPQLGIVQTDFLLHQALLYGIDTRVFVNVVATDDRWRKWDHGRLRGDPWLRARVAGHYHYTSEEYQNIYDRLEYEMDIRQALIEEHRRVITHYLEGLCTQL